MLSWDNHDEVNKGFQLPPQVWSFFEMTSKLAFNKGRSFRTSNSGQPHRFCNLSKNQPLSLSFSAPYFSFFFYKQENGYEGLQGKQSELWDIFKIQFNIPSVPSKYECITFQSLIAFSIFYLSIV